MALTEEQFLSCVLHTATSNVVPSSGLPPPAKAYLMCQVFASLCVPVACRAYKAALDPLGPNTAAKAVSTLHHRAISLAPSSEYLEAHSPSHFT